MLAEQLSLLSLLFTAARSGSTDDASTDSMKACLKKPTCHPDFCNTVFNGVGQRLRGGRIRLGIRLVHMELLTGLHLSFRSPFSLFWSLLFLVFFFKKKLTQQIYSWLRKHPLPLRPRQRRPITSAHQGSPDPDSHEPPKSHTPCNSYNPRTHPST
jgi:hypothetical protein